MDWDLLHMQNSQSGVISWWILVTGGYSQVHACWVRKTGVWLSILDLDRLKLLFHRVWPIKDHKGTRLNSEKARACRKCEGCAFAAVMTSVSSVYRLCMTLPQSKASQPDKGSRDASIISFAAQAKRAKQDDPDSKLFIEWMSSEKGSAG